ncbi:MAG: hypothetical protein AAGB31_01935 [Bdellovibrio sp.]
MLKKVMLAMLVSVSTLAAPWGAWATVTSDEHVMPAGSDPWVPWPWALAQPFPWSDIQGFWKVEEGDFTSYFALKVVRQKSTGVHQLQLKQFDGETCKVLAAGVGIERNQKVFAQMTSKGGITYRVQLTAFNEKDSPLPPLKGAIPTEAVMVLSMGRLDERTNDEMVHIQIMKISAHLTQRTCIDDVKK